MPMLGLTLQVPTTWRVRVGLGVGLGVGSGVSVLDFELRV